MNKDLVKTEFNKLETGDKEGFVTKDVLYDNVCKILGLDKSNPYRLNYDSSIPKDYEFEKIISELRYTELWDKIDGDRCYFLKRSTSICTLKAQPDEQLEEILHLPEFTLKIDYAHGLYKGYIEEFGLWSFSRQEDQDIAIKKIKDRSENILLSHIHSNFSYNTIQNVYFTEELNKTNKGVITKMINTYNKFIDCPEGIEKLFKYLSSINTSIWEVKEASKIKEMHTIILNQLHRYLKECKELANEKKKDKERIFQSIIQMLSYFTGFYQYNRVSVVSVV